MQVYNNDLVRVTNGLLGCTANIYDVTTCGSVKVVTKSKCGILTLEASQGGSSGPIQDGTNFSINVTEGELKIKVDEETVLAREKINALAFSLTQGRGLLTINRKLATDAKKGVCKLYEALVLVEELVEGGNLFLCS